MAEEHGWPAVEYDNKTPRALVEYKARGARVNPNDANNMTLRRLADMAQLPFFITVYDKEAVLFGVLPQNDVARRFCSKATLYTESQYVEFMLRVRGR